ncbi:hypothetical protein RF11_04187 [Thelohanellus kitauei]|uniref:Uncharacterized protein n=1 Tax=Thelohanellus kitauei TaxID=669202 RepID=A0A0C2J6N3_THEKT|nr:hypothetical protein RF11_04187 [Thelohanellus kitauei]
MRINHKKSVCISVSKYKTDSIPLDFANDKIPPLERGRSFKYLGIEYIERMQVPDSLRSGLIEECISDLEKLTKLTLHKATDIRLIKMFVYSKLEHVHRIIGFSDLNAKDFDLAGRDRLKSYLRLLGTVSNSVFYSSWIK